MFSFKWYFEKKWVGRAMGNKTIYWDGLTKKSTRYKVCGEILKMSICLSITKGNIYYFVMSLGKTSPQEK